MITRVQFQGVEYITDLSKPIDISIPLRGNSENPSAWYLSPPEVAGVVLGDLVGSVASGAATRFNTVVFKPQAHGTLAGWIGHIAAEFHAVGDSLKRYVFICELITV